MAKEPPKERLRELSWRRPLTPDEIAELRRLLKAQPQGLADWEIEAVLTEVLRRLPEAPVPSNFTARVLQTLERETAPEPRRHTARRWLTHWLPKAAAAAVVLAAGFLSYEHVKAVRHRAELAESVAAVSEVSTLPNPAILQDFDAILALSTTPAPDEQLLALFQ